MLGDDTRKPNRLTLTPETLLTPAALDEAEAEELKLKNQRLKDWDVAHHSQSRLTDSRSSPLETGDRRRSSSTGSVLRPAVQSGLKDPPQRHRGSETL